MSLPAVLLTRVFVYPEEIRLTGAKTLARKIADLGFDGVTVAMTYHRGRRVLARHGIVDTLVEGGLAFSPRSGCYGRVKPAGEPMADDAELDEFRAACEEVGLGFGAWVVGLYVDELVRRHPDLSTESVGGRAMGVGLCPSRPESVEYVASLVRDVCTRFAPDLIDLEGALYPSWEPSFTQTITLVEIPEELRRLLAQCFCDACVVVAHAAGIDAEGLGGCLRTHARRVLAGVRTTPSTKADMDALAQLRSGGAAQLVDAVTRAVPGTPVRVLGFGEPADLRLQGFTPTGLAGASAVAIGYGTRSGASVEARQSDVHHLMEGREVAAVVNWSPRRQADGFATDVAGLAARGAQALSAYNLSLVPAHAEGDLSAAAHAWREAKQ